MTFYGSRGRAERLSCVAGFDSTPPCLLKSRGLFPSHID
jgi:hypothetical protein